ncbi:MAG: rhodanese domain-containing protein [Rickettsiaceae bacterium]|nr:rhodanese domain-containing protein [Rickettsiaceae bacterium]
MYQDKIAILNSYAFVAITNVDELMLKILRISFQKCIKGTVILAEEGFNLGVSGSYENVNLLLELIAKETGIASENINSKLNYSDVHPFEKLKVKIKKEIVQMGVLGMKTSELSGEYIEPKYWDDFIAQNDVVLVDTRNDYEVSEGTFANSLNPKTSAFREFPLWAKENKKILENKKVAMFCTGGIRCEKSTAFLKTIGISEVYHLKGGILQYLEDTQNINNNWSGDCFVFDERRLVDKNLAPVK